MSYPSEIKYITLAQIIGCGLVILGHSYPFVSEIPEYANVFRDFLYTFHMPLFVWCSGFLFAHTKQSTRKTFRQYLCQRASRLLIPYFALSLIGLLPKIMASSVLNDNLELNAIQIVRAFLVPRECVWGHFWFLPMIFWLGLLCFIADKIIKSAKGWIVLTLIAFCFSFIKLDCLKWLGVNDVLAFFVFFCIGVVCRKYELEEINKRSISVVVVILGIMVSLVLYFMVHGGFGVIHIRNTIIALMMISSIVQLCRLFENKIRVTRNSLIAQTYQVFILSWPCQLVAGIIVERILHWNWFVFIPIVFVTGILMPLLLIITVDNFERKTDTRFLSLILGRS